MLFMHNGQIGGYRSIRRELEQKIPAELFSQRSGTTDSEAFFLLACGNGLERDVPEALARTVNEVLEVMKTSGTDEPVRMTAAVADGERVYALRYSSDKQSPTLYYGTGGAIRVENRCVEFSAGDEAALVLSEPLDAGLDDWIEIPEGHILTASGGFVEVSPFRV